MNLPWFRMYAEFAADPVIQSLAFEDQRHYVIVLCLKCNGVLDRRINAQAKDRIIGRALGLDNSARDEAKRRLMEVNLIDKKWQPKGWDKRQFVSDNSTERVRKSRKSKKTGNVTETPSNSSSHAPDTETDTDTESTRFRFSKKVGLPEDFCITDNHRKWAADNGVRHLEKHLSHFVDKCRSKGYQYKDWDAAFRNAMRDNWANIQTSAGQEVYLE